MTLIVTLAAPWGVFHSSDCLLTDSGTGRPVALVAGLKQLGAAGGLRMQHWRAQIAFTGVARVGPYDTRAWISAAFARMGGAHPLRNVVQELADSGSQELQRIPPHRRHLTVVMAALVDRRVRLFLISNFDRLSGRPLAQPAERLEIFEITPKRPLVSICGVREAVCRPDLRLLQSILKHRVPAEEILDTLGRVNERASRNPQSRGLISRQCLVNYLLRDGTGRGKNIGGALGVPDEFMGGFNFGGYVRENFRFENGQWLVLRDGRWVAG